jgi:signal transduction histidine kinase
MSIADVDLVLGERYRCLKLLKASRGMATSLGCDLRDGSDVIVKVVNASLVSPAARHRLEHEATILGQVRTPWAAPIIDVGSDADRLWIVQPKIPGTPLATHLTARSVLAVADVMTIARCLLTALAETHRQGVLHRHVRPDRIIVDPSPPLSGATLVGFGLARSALLKTLPRNEPVRTVQYMSPEQTGSLDRDLDARSDLYSVGVVLYQCLAGTAPFTGRTVHEILLHHVATPPSRLHDLAIDTPPALDDLVHRLLQQDPEDRYPSAEAALADLEAFTGVDSDLPASALEATHHPRLTEPSLVGRDVELSVLEMFLERARTGYGGLVLLQAESGGGKTRLMEELSQRSVARDAWVLRGQAMDQVGQQPLGLLTGVANEILARARADDDLASRLRTQLAHHARAICDVLPELERVLLPDGRSRSGPEEHKESRSLRVLGALFEALGSEEQPAVVLLDDCQWADELSRKLLAAWSKPGAKPRGRHRHVLVVAAFRTDSEEQGTHLLPDIRGDARITLRPLESDQVRQLVESMAGPLPPEVLDVLVRTSEGSPFMASAILRGLAESGALVSTPSGWRAHIHAVREVRSARYAVAFLAKRVDLLPPECFQLISIGALLGREFDLALAAGIAGTSLATATASIQEAKRRHMVWLSESGTTCIFVHDQLRSVVLDRLAPEDRRRLHRLAGLELESTGLASAFDLSYHFDAAGEYELALPYALAAAEQARSRHALAIAEEQCRIARRADADDETRLHVAESLGDVLVLRGTYTEATHCYREALTYTDSNLVKARLEARLADVAHKQGDMPGAIEPLERALRLLGLPVPRFRITFRALIIKEACIQIVHRLAARRLVGRRSAGKGQVDLLAAHIYQRLEAVWWNQGGAHRTFWAALRQLNLAERCEPTQELGQAYATFGLMLAHYTPRLARFGFWYAQRSLAVRRDLGDLWGEAQALNFYGLLHYAVGEYASAVDQFEHAARLLERTGDPYERNTAIWHTALCHYRLGELRLATDESRRLYYQATQIGGLSASRAALEIWAKAAGEHFPTDVLARELERPPGPVQHQTRLLQAQAIQLLHASRPEQAVELMERARRLVADTRSRDPYLAPVFVWLASARRRAAETAPVWSHRQRRHLLRAARRDARRALRVARAYRNDLPHALREAALVHAMRGRLRRARRLLDRSLTVAERHGAQYEYAESLRARGAIGVTNGWRGASEDLAVGEQLLSRLVVTAEVNRSTHESEKVLGLMDRFDTILEVGRQIASAETYQDIWESANRAAMALLRAEECAIVELTATPEGSRVIAGQATCSWSTSVAEEALASGSPVWCPDEVGRTACGQTRDACGAHSGLYVPIHAQSAPVCFFASHSRIRGLFGKDEARLAEFIASVASAASERIHSEHQTLGREIAAQESERARLSRDLHDEIGQDLTSALLSLRLLHDTLDGEMTSSEDRFRRAAQVRAILASTLQKVRGLAFELRPTLLDDLGLSAALRRLVKELASRHDLVIDLTIDGLDGLDGHRLPPDIETAAYRVCQESLGNVIRHAGCVYCSVSLSIDDSTLRAIIEDDGAGFDLEEVAPESLGLRGMRERATLVGGSLGVHSATGSGTRVVLEVPLG